MRFRVLAVLIFLPLSLNAAVLTGRVADSAGRPVPNAHVYIYTALPLVGMNTICPSCYRDCGKHVPVKADGTYRVDDLDPTLKFRALAVAEGFEPMLSAGHVDPSKHQIDFALKRRDVSDCQRTVIGRVVDPKGKPLVGAVVERHAVRQPRGIGYGNIPNIDPLSITNANGEFALRVDEPTTKLDVRVRARNFAPEIARELIPDQSRTIAVDVGASVSGVITKNGKPQKGVYLKVLHADRRSYYFLGDEDIATDDRGVFIVTGLGPEQDYSITLPRAKEPLKALKTGGDGTSADVGSIEMP